MTLNFTQCLPFLLALSSSQVASAFISTKRSTSSSPDCLFAKSSSWATLEGILGAACNTATPSSIDSVLNPEKPTFSTEHPTLFRERHGWCPYSERVWLTLEILNHDYDTIRIDNTGGERPSYYGGQTPQMKWPDAYLFQYNGEPLWKSTFQETLAKTDALLGETKNGGPFFGGSDTVTAADIAWAPFLERYRYQLPCLHQGLEPDDPESYPNLAAWYKAMEERVPAYACRVKGDASSWRKVLSMAGFGNSGAPPQIGSNMQEQMQKEFQEAASCIQQTVWDQYAFGRPYVASTPGGEAALIMTRNRDRIVQDILKQQLLRKNAQALTLPDSQAELDAALRGLVSVLLQSNAPDWDTSSLDSAEGVGALASFLDERMCVPRDMGAMSAACIKDLAWKLSS